MIVVNEKTLDSYASSWIRFIVYLSRARDDPRDAKFEA